ncbi:MAG: DUF1003 domain-containing protein [Syntrophaceae bacterium]
MKKTDATRVCQICGAGVNAELRPGVMVRPAVGELIRRDHAGWDENGWICANDLQHYRHKYVEELLKDEKGELTAIDREVLDNINAQEILSRNPIDDYDAQLTIGERLADKIADFGGSWKFISFFGVVIICWMGVNSYLLAARPFDPYPYILLNLVLSCLAALQAPVIMMSQNRQESRDRERATHDYQVNLKAELEIRHLHQKIDHLMSHQWERLVEIQQLQMDFMNELRGKR